MVRARQRKREREREREREVPTNLMPPDSISQAALRAVLNQNSRRRSYCMCYIGDYVRMPQGRQYPSFLPESCSLHASSVWLGRLENGQLNKSDGKGIAVMKESSQHAAKELSMRKVSLELLLDSPRFDRSPYAS
jgi:hypothetical protein